MRSTTCSMSSMLRFLGSGEASAFLTFGGRASEAAARPPAAAAPPMRRRRLKPLRSEGVAESAIKVLSMGRPAGARCERGGPPAGERLALMVDRVAVRSQSGGWPIAEEQVKVPY